MVLILSALAKLWIDVSMYGCACVLPGFQYRGARERGSVGGEGRGVYGVDEWWFGCVGGDWRVERRGEHVV